MSRHKGFKNERNAVLLLEGCIFLDCFPSSGITRPSIGHKTTDVKSPGAGVLCRMGPCGCFREFFLENVQS